jgi:general secretion pathway protein G
LTIVELVIAMALVVTLAGILVPAYSNYREDSRVDQAIVEIRTLEQDILTHEGFAGRLPDSLAEIGRGDLRDPWGYPYQYLSSYSSSWKSDHRRDRFLNPINPPYPMNPPYQVHSFDLYSLGRNGKSKRQLDNKDSEDDIVRAVNGGFVDLASKFDM